MITVCESALSNKHTVNIHLKMECGCRELCLEILKSQYLDLVEGKVTKELLQITKEVVIAQLRLMLKVVEDIH